MKKTQSAISKSQVLHIAKLANLKLTPQELSRYRSQLAQIIHFFQSLQKINTKKVLPTSQTTGLKNITRKDTPSSCLTQKQTLSTAKNKTKDYFKTKSVF